jgi:hypothetical protein
MKILLLLLSPGLIGLLALFLSVVWMLRDQRDRTRPILVIALVVNLFYGFVLNVVMGREDGLVPWKYDHVLARLDEALGVTAAMIAPFLQGGWRFPLLVIYQLMVPTMILWYMVARRRGLGAAVVRAYIVEMVTGPLLYAVVPACGPIYAFRIHWLHPPLVHPDVIRLAGMPNAFPSLHIATATVFLFFANGRLWRAASLAMIAGTALATISTGEHYLIDLVAGVAFGCFAAKAGYLRFKSAGLYLGIALAWSLAVRFQFQLLMDHPGLLRSCAGLTLLAAAVAIGRQWRSEPGKEFQAESQIPLKIQVAEQRVKSIVANG